jgi:mono/diheme cytochrome c family protein
MPSFGWLLTDDEVAAVVTYIRNAWGDAGSAISDGDVKSARSDLAPKPD